MSDFAICFSVPGRGAADDRGGSRLPKIAPVLGLGLLSLGGAAGAQTLPERRLDIGISVVNSYDTNILRLPEDGTAPPGQSRDDIRATPSFTVDIEQPLGRQSVFLSGSAGYDFYRENDQLERERIELTGGTNLNLQACGSRLAATYGRQQSDLADILPGERQVNTQTRTLYQGEIACRGFGPLEPTFSYERERVENSDPMRRNGNTTSDTYSVGVNYFRPVFGSVGAQVSYSDARYDRTADLPPGRTNGIKTYTADFTFERRIGSQLTGTASIGVTRVDPSLPDVPGFKGLSYSADLRWTPGTRLQARVGLSREAQQPNLLNISYAIVDTYQGRIQYALGNRIRLTIGADYLRRSLRDSALTQGPVLQTEDRRLLLFGGASYQAGERLTFSLDARAERRRSDVKELSFNNFSVALTTRLTI